MPLFDLPLAQLRDYRPDRVEPPDFDAFWARTLGGLDPRPVRERQVVDGPLRTVAVTDVTFAGFADDPVKAWFLSPVGPGAVDTQDRPACVIHIPGYQSGRGYPHQWLTYVVAGFSVFVMDVRGQGGGSGHPGATGDPAGGVNGEVPGFLTRGIASADTYYLRRLYTDGYRAIDAARELTGPSATVVIAAGSQGGGVGLAVAGLRSDLGPVLLDVPSFAAFRRATEISGSGSRAEISQYLATHRESVDDVFATLAYFDTVNFAARASAPARFSVALMDHVCPPSTVFAAYNHYAGPKDIDVWPYNGHEGGGALQVGRHLETLAAWAAGTPMGTFTGTLPGTHTEEAP